MARDSEDRKEKWQYYTEEYARKLEVESLEDNRDIKLIFKLDTPRPGERALDVGCNTGQFCELLKRKYGAIPKGIDINEAAIAIARQKYPGIEFQVADVRELSETAHYDVIHMQQVIEHLEDAAGTLTKLRSILADDGRLVISCPNGWAFLDRFNCWLHGVEFCYDPTHLSLFDPLSLCKILRGSGFRIAKLATKPLGIPYLGRLSQGLKYAIPALLFGGGIFLVARKGPVKG